MNTFPQLNPPGGGRLPRCSGVALAGLLALAALLALPTTSASADAAQAPQVTNQSADFAADAAASEPRPVVAMSFLRSALGNRTRMIQITTVVVAIGIAFLMWGKLK